MPNKEPEVICQCYDCGDDIVEGDDYHSKEGHEYCQSCWDDNHFCCADCSNIEYNDNYYQDDNGNRICQRCSDNYYSCESCGEIIHPDHTFTNNDGCYCEYCFGDRDEPRNRLIHDYSYTPRELVFSKEPWENTLYLGIELEVELRTSGDLNEQAEKLRSWIVSNGLDRYIYFKEDASLENGIEIVFHPATLQSIHKKYKLRQLLTKIKELGFSAFGSGNCGLHVHISRKNMKDNSLYRGMIFFYKCQSWLKKLSGRSLRRLNYCRFYESMPKDLRDQPYGRYTAFNALASDATAEVRVFRGTLNHEKFVAYLQFCDVFADFIQKTGTSFYKTNGGFNIWGEFIRFIRQSNRHKNLLDYLITKGTS